MSGNNEQVIKNLIAQVEAHKSLLNEQLQVGLSLRTNVVLFQQHNKELADKNAELEKQVAELKAKLEAAQPVANPA